MLLIIKYFINQDNFLQELKHDFHFTELFTQWQNEVENKFFIDTN